MSDQKEESKRGNKFVASRGPLVLNLQFCHTKDDIDENLAEDEPYDFPIDEEPDNHMKRLPTRISSLIYMDINDINFRLNKIVKELSELLETSDDDTLILFHHYKWNKNKLENSEYFSNPNKIRVQAGLIPLDYTSVKPTNKAFQCPLCWNVVSISEIDAPDCGHPFCNSCWEDYLKEKIYDKNDGAFWKCPSVECTHILSGSFNKKHLPQGGLTAYEKKIAMSYAEENKAIKWCPTPDCKFCVENPSLVSRPIACRCGYIYCFKCCKEDHRPCECLIVEDWLSKNSNEFKDTKWISRYTKMCPKCRIPIEKARGCDHIICRCGYEFCWLCLDRWESSHYPCLTYTNTLERENKKQQENIDRELSERNKYFYFFERFDNHDTGLKVAQGLLKNTVIRVEEFYDKYNLRPTEVFLLNEAAKILVECKRVLKWSYAFVYYIQDARRSLYEFRQKNLEEFTEKLLESLEMYYKTEIREELGKLDLEALAKYKNEVLSLKDKCQNFLTGFLADSDQF